MFRSKYVSSIGEESSTPGMKETKPQSTRSKEKSGEGYQDPFQYFDGIKTPTSIGVVGVTGSGKTVLVEALLRKVRTRFEAVYVMTGSGRVNDDYHNVVPAHRILPLNMRTLQKIISTQDSFYRRNLKPQICVVLDDWIGHVSTQSTLFDRIAASARHVGITMVYLAQRITKMSTTVRDNCRYWVVTKVARPSLEILYQYQTEYGNKAQFITEMLNIQPWCSFVINNHEPYSKNVTFLRSVR